MPSSFVKLKQDILTDFQRFPTDVTDPLRPVIISPLALLTRYSVAAEKQNGLLGAYDPFQAHDYQYPNRRAGSIIDQSYTKLFVDNALLKYWDKATGVSGTVNPVSGHSNQIRASDFVFKANANYPRNAAFGDRDVQVGDVIDIRGIVNGTEYDKRTAVISFTADPVFATVGTAAAGATNAATQGASATSSKIGGPNNQIQITESSADRYNGLATGDVKETYTIEVMQGSINGDLTRARLKITSASGDDNWFPLNGDGTQGVIPAAEGTPFNITPRGAEITFGIVAGDPVDVGEPADDLIAGQKWSLQVNEAWTATTVTAGGVYNGQQDTTYIATVVNGGLFGAQGPQGPQGPQGAQGAQGPQASSPTIMITTTTGVDSSGPISVPTANTAIPIGSQGVVLSFGGNGLVKGDRFTVPVNGQKSGPQKTLILQDNLPDALVNANPLPDLAVKLYIRKNVQITSDRAGQAPLMNWTADGNYVYVNPGFTAFDPSYTFNLVQQSLPVVEGQVYVETRQWLQDKANTLDIVSSVADVTNKLGVIHPDNPLAWATNQARLNASGSLVSFGILGGDPTQPQSWISFLDVLGNLGGIYNIAPMTSDPTVLAAYAAHVNTQSAPEVGAYRGMWGVLTARSTRPVITQKTTTDGNPALATLTADPVTGLLTQVKVPAGTAKFITNPNVNPLVWPAITTGSSTTNPAVRSGDVFRFQFTTDSLGNAQWTEYTVDHVVNEDTLILTTPAPTTFTVPQQFEIWHPMSKNDITNDLLTQAAPLKSNRVRIIWPDTVDNLPGYFLAAGLAGSSSGAVTNQGLKNVQLLGYTDVSRSKYLGGANLLKLAQNGIWTVSQDALGNVYTSAAVNTDVSSVLNQEEVITRNTDAIVFYVLNSLQKLVGVANVVDDTLTSVRGVIIAATNALRAINVTGNLGPPLTAVTILQLRQHAILKDRVVATLQLTMSFPLNQVQIVVSIVS